MTNAGSLELAYTLSANKPGDPLPAISNPAIELVPIADNPRHRFSLVSGSTSLHMQSGYCQEDVQ